MGLQSINPANGDLLEIFASHDVEEQDRLVEAADHAFQDWKAVPVASRAERMRRVAVLLRREAEACAHWITREMGKPIAESRSEVEKCAWVCEYYADHAEVFLAPDVIETDARRSYVTYRPLGVVFAVMPWNFPFWQVFRFAAPTLMAGNAAVVKHAPNVTGTALEIGRLFREAGFPPDLLGILLIEPEEVPERSARAIRHPLVRAVTLTGSTRAGAAVAREAGAVLKKCVLELGGSDPYLVLEDADVEQAARTCVTSRMLNSGQSCIAAKRFVVDRRVRGPFVEALVGFMQERKVGDPMDPATTVGPMARLDLRDALHRQVEESVRAGATLRLGGSVPGGPGAFYPPTVLTDAGPGMPAYTEELFGPVAAVITVDGEAEAVRVANDTSYGLGASVFTGDPARGERIAAELLEAGSCFVNTFVRSDPRLPFGGIKRSGYGRELGPHGIKEFVNVKTVFVGV